MPMTSFSVYRVYSIFNETGAISVARIKQQCKRKQTKEIEKLMLVETLQFLTVTWNRRKCDFLVLSLSAHENHKMQSYCAHNVNLNRWKFAAIRRTKFASKWSYTFERSKKEIEPINRLVCTFYSSFKNNSFVRVFFSPFIRSESSK